ncbi:hypothetical protein QQF64_030155 [Cirrhinus molitorella]|uniref:Uncharacterized protein n=1 Tax=Cirrhinus molitorella TaxID=172907 RepID=A0ABR3N2K8_9TELE
MPGDVSLASLQEKKARLPLGPQLMLPAAICKTLCECKKAENGSLSSLLRAEMGPASWCDQRLALSSRGV